MYLLGEIDWKPILDSMWAHSPLLGTLLTIVVAFLSYLKRERKTTSNTRHATLAVYVAEVNHLAETHKSEMRHEQHEHRMAVAAMCDKFGAMHAINMEVMNRNTGMLALLQGQNERIIMALDNMNGHAAQPILQLPPDVPG